MLSVDDLFKGRHFDREVIILCVRWYLRYKLSYRDLVEMMAERGLSLAHTTIMRWVQRYVPEFEQLNRISTMGSWLIATGFVIGLITMIRGLTNGPKAPMNPWGAKTLEWTAAESPPIMHNFDHEPIVTAGPYEYK